MVAKVLGEQAQDQPQPVLGEAELSTALALRASTSEVNMARTPYVTVRGDVPAAPPPKPKEIPMAEAETEVETEAVYLADADRVEKLLDIIRNTVDMPNVPCIRAAASAELAQIEHDLWEQMYPEQAEAEEARLKAAQEAEEARLERMEEEKAKAKEDKPQPDSWVPPRDTQAQPTERRI
jgi:hypothetical protein